jgi:undecaprenyl diphosphate synthase
LRSRAEVEISRVRGQSLKKNLSALPHLVSSPSNFPGTWRSSWTETAAEARRLGLEQLTLFCLSVENWKRPERELRFLMRLLKHFLIVERSELKEQQIRLRMIGGREGLPADVLRELDKTVHMTADHKGMTLCLAVNYGGRTEIVEAARRLALDAQTGRLEPGQVNEAVFSSYLATAGQPDPDLLIRTAGEMRVSNFLLWQISYAELWVTDVLWPEFAAADLHGAIVAYAGRKRKFGGLS